LGELRRGKVDSVSEFVSEFDEEEVTEKEDEDYDSREMRRKV
jgi:hypothetical protein